MKIVVGDILQSKAQTLINTVNCVGIMGKGIALEFKKRFPQMFQDYVERCERKEVKPGVPYLFIVNTLKGMPKRRLRIVRDIVGALAEPQEAETREARTKKVAPISLLKTPFCGMWEKRVDITNGRSYAETLRQRLEHR